MNRRFVLSFAVAVLLGFVAAQEIPAEPVQPVEPAQPAEPVEPTPEEPVKPVEPAEPVEPVEPATPKTPEELQQDFVNRNAVLKKTAKEETEKLIQCNLFADFAYFNLNDLRGPYVKDVNISGTQVPVEFRFCVPVAQNDTQGAKSALAFTLDEQNNRTLRLTSGDLALSGVNTIRSVDEDSWDVTGLKYSAHNSSEPCPYGAANETFRTDFTVMCDADVTEVVQDKIQFWQDSTEKCLFHAQVTHKAGCPTLEVSGLVQYFMNHPWLVSLALVSFGVVSCFFGGLLFDYVVATLAGILAFFVVCMFAQALGGFNSLEANAKLSAGRVIATIFSFLVAGAAGVAAGWFVKKTARIAKTLLGCAGGFFVSVLVYGLVFAKFVTQSTWLIFVVMVFGLVAGGYLVYKFDKVILVQLTATVGAYTIIRGISIIAGGYISEIDIMSEMSSGNFELPNTFYAYLAGFVALAVGGTFFQWHKNYHKHFHAEGDIDEHFLPK